MSTFPRTLARPALRRRVAALAGALLTTAALLSVPTSAAAGSSPDRVTASAFVTRYAVSRPVCAAPSRPGVFTCMAYRRVDVPKGTPGAQRYTIPRWARGPAGGLTPTAITEAYGINPSIATHQTVAIVDWNSDPYVRADLTHFDRHYGLPAETATSFRVVNESGKPAPLPAADPEAAVEISLDVQAVRAVCHKCKILLVEASEANEVNLARAENTAVRLGAKIVSNSFGAPEQRGHPYPASVVSAFSHPGVVITASSGDNGWDFWDIANDDPFGYASYAPQSASFPASVPTVVSVGGTRLALKADGSRGVESVWNENGANDVDGLTEQTSLGASGGGCSTQFTSPSWQHSLFGYVQSGCNGKRLSVDVSADADPWSGFDVYDRFGIGGWGTVGGTSLSSPLIAGMWALSGGPRGMAHPAQALYQNYRFRKGVLHDITTGGNAWCAGATTTACASAATDFGGVNNPNYVYGAFVDCSFSKWGHGSTPPATKNPQCNAVTGYDGASGVGTPNGLGSFRTTVPALQVTASSARKAHHAIVFKVLVHTVVSTDHVVRRAWSWGDGSSTIAPGYTTSHRYAKAGNYKVRVTVTDSLGQRVASVNRILVK